jgi:hypothetical protein
MITRIKFCSILTILKNPAILSKKNEPII